MKHPRIRELVLLVGVAGFFFLGFMQLGDVVFVSLVAFVAVVAVLHVAVRILAPSADPIVLPVACLLVAIGLLQLAAIDVGMSGRSDRLSRFSEAQAGWLAASAGAFTVTLYGFRKGLGVAWRFKYSMALVGLAALLSPMLPVIGHEISGARLWLRIGPMSFQPLEIAKVLLVLFLAAYLSERRELLSLRIRKIGPLNVPDPRYLTPLVGMIGLSLLVFVRQNELGSSLLFFVVFISVLWIATGNFLYPTVGISLFAVGVYVMLQLFPHVRPRFTAWIDPFATPRGSGFQVVQGWFAMAEGGLGGVGLSGENVQPELIPVAWTDLIFAAVGHTLGLAGVLAVVGAFIMLLTRCFFISLRSRSELHALAAAGFGIIIGTQAVVIAGGIMRILPLTGVTLPFISYGGSSLLANFVMLACLLAISNTEQTTSQRRTDLVEVDA